MCTIIGHPGYGAALDESLVEGFASEIADGVRINLCDGDSNPLAVVNRIIELLAELEITEPNAPAVQEPLRRVLRAFVPTATTLIIERDYFDLDYRSEFTATHETTFSVRKVKTDRLHFFSQSVAEHLDITQATELLAAHYLGYTVLRPQIKGAIGRSLIPDTGSARLKVSSRALLPALDEGATRPAELVGEDLRKRIRTHGTEWVELFGVFMKAKGVPFMQQDGHLLRCGHVSAWICHYTAVLRAYVKRQPSAAFHAAEDDTGAYGRQYPSTGVNYHLLSTILRRLDLPPEITYREDLEQAARPLAWHDRKPLKDEEYAHRNRTCKCVGCGYKTRSRRCKPACADCRLNLGEVSAEHLDPLQHESWVDLSLRENLTATVCRFLNSGLPVILAEEHHTRVICGYLRKSDAVLGGGKDSTKVGAFILQDDESEPFTIETIDDLMNELGQDQPFALIVPLPRGVWMSGSTAEAVGVEVVRHYVATTPRADPDSVDEATAALRELQSRVDATLAGTTSDFTVRCYVAGGSDTKVSLRQRALEPDMARAIALCRLPKFVWVVEVIGRARRDGDDPRSVVASVVIDASFVSDALADGDMNIVNVLASKNPVLFAQVPGCVYRWQGDGDEEVVTNLGPMLDDEDAATWHYESGRWGHSATVEWSSSIATAHAAKGLST